MKEFDSLALIVTLVEPPLGTPPMAPNVFTIRSINLVILWFYVVVSLAAPQMIKRHPIRLKTPWTSSPPLHLPPHVFWEIHPFLNALGPICPFFFSLAHSKGELRNAHRHLIKRQMEIDVFK
jgi:hypothetical protein